MSADREVWRDRTAAACVLLFASVALFPLPFLASLKLELAGGAIAPYHLIFTLWSLGLAAAAVAADAPRAKTEALRWAPLGLLLLLSSAFASDPAGALKTTASFAIRGFIPGWALAVVCTNDSRRGYVLKAMVLLAGAAALNGLSERFFHRNVPFDGFYRAIDPIYLKMIEGRGGVVGTVGHPVPFASFLAMALPVALTAPDRRWMRAVGGALIVAAIVATESRSALVATAASMTTLMVFRGRGLSGRARAIVVTVTMSTIALAYYGLGSYFSSRLLRSPLKETHRIQALKGCGRLAAERPILGHGPGSYPGLHERIAGGDISPEIRSPDNQYARFAVELGFVGLAVLIAIALGLAAPAFVGATGDFGGVASALVAGAVSLFFFDGFYWLATHFALWVCLGLARSLRGDNEGRKT